MNEGEGMRKMGRREKEKYEGRNKEQIIEKGN